MALSTPRPLDPQAQAMGQDGRAIPGTAAAFRVCRTLSGALVREGHPDAAFLAYPQGELIPVHDELEYRALLAPAPVSEVDVPEKQGRRPADKMVRASANK